jgi:hypothetical protein
LRFTAPLDPAVLTVLSQAPKPRYTFLSTPPPASGGGGGGGSSAPPRISIKRFANEDGGASSRVYVSVTRTRFLAMLACVRAIQQQVLCRAQSFCMHETGAESAETDSKLVHLKTSELALLSTQVGRCALDADNIASRFEGHMWFYDYDMDDIAIGSMNGSSFQFESTDQFVQRAGADQYADVMTILDSFIKYVRAFEHRSWSEYMIHSLMVGSMQMASNSTVPLNLGQISEAQPFAADYSFAAAASSSADPEMGQASTSDGTGHHTRKRVHRAIQNAQFPLIARQMHQLWHMCIYPTYQRLLSHFPDASELVSLAVARFFTAYLVECLSPLDDSDYVYLSTTTAVVSEQQQQGNASTECLREITNAMFPDQSSWPFVYGLVFQLFACDAGTFEFLQPSSALPSSSSAQDSMVATTLLQEARILRDGGLLSIVNRGGNESGGNSSIDNIVMSVAEECLLRAKALLRKTALFTQRPSLITDPFFCVNGVNALVQFQDPDYRCTDDTHGVVIRVFEPTQLTLSPVLQRLP